jgi:hypothetical protein
MEFSLLVVVKEYLIDHETFGETSPCLRSLESSPGAKFQVRLIWLAEACLSSTKKLLKCKVHIFLYVPDYSKWINHHLFKQHFLYFNPLPQGQ